MLPIVSLFLNPVFSQKNPEFLAPFHKSVYFRPDFCALCTIWCKIMEIKKRRWSFAFIRSLLKCYTKHIWWNLHNLTIYRQILGMNFAASLYHPDTNPQYAKYYYSHYPTVRKVNYALFLLSTQEISILFCISIC